jgi:methylmalonyl-CoA/ethylmalonyl-CoA epimerase
MHCRFDHVAVATRAIPEAYRLFHDLLGGQFVLGGDDEELQIRVLQLTLPPGTKIELMQPLAETSYLHRYLTRHGEGFHHMTMVVTDVEQAVDELTAADYELVDTDLSSHVA